MIAAPQDPVGDNAGFVWSALLNGKSVDALAVANALRPLLGNDAALDGFGTSLGLAGGQLPTFRTVATAWMQWLDDLAVNGDTPGASPYWNAHRLEYSFGLQADGTQPLIRLDADEYTDGKLDWHTFTLSAAQVQAKPNAEVIVVEPERPPMPTIARYPGMPSDRYWEFEDGRVNFGMIGAAKTDLARIAVIEYALVFGNDWFTLPITLPVNALYQVEKLDVRDNFGIIVKIPPAKNSDGSQWTMYEMSVSVEPARGPSAPDRQVVPVSGGVSARRSSARARADDARRDGQHGVGHREARAGHVRRAVRSKVREQPAVDHAGTCVHRPTPSSFPSGAPLNYKLQTPVAANWIPFLPVKKAGATPFNWSIQLQRGVVTHHYQVTQARLDDPRNADYKAFIERLRAAPFVEKKPRAGLARQSAAGVHVPSARQPAATRPERRGRDRLPARSRRKRCRVMASS